MSFLFSTHRFNRIQDKSVKCIWFRSNGWYIDVCQCKLLTNWNSKPTFEDSWKIPGDFKSHCLNKDFFNEIVFFLLLFICKGQVTKETKVSSLASYSLHLISSRFTFFEVSWTNSKWFKDKWLWKRALYKILTRSYRITYVWTLEWTIKLRIALAPC